MNNSIQPSLVGVLAAAAAALSGCGDNRAEQTIAPDAATVDALFNGPTKNGGYSPSQAPTETGDNGPYVTDVPCCQTSMTFNGPPGGTVTLIGKLKPFESPGLAMTHDGIKWKVNVCFPISLAMDFYFAVAPPSAAASTQVNPIYFIYEDENGQAWNELFINSCSELP